MVERYATERIAPAHRIRRWCEFGSSTLPQLAVHPSDPREFRALLLRTILGDLGVTKMHTTPAVAVSCGAERSAWAGCPSGSVVVTLQKTGKSRIVQAGREVMLFPGDVVIRDLRRHWELEACLDTTLVSIKVPAHRLAEKLGDLSAYLAVPLRMGENRTNLLASVVENLGRLAFEHPFRADPGSVDQIFFGAARIAYEGTAAETASHLTEERYFHQLCTFVDDRLRDATVTVAGLAAELHMSVRTFQRVFYENGTSPRAYILDRRLELAAEDLTDRARGGCPLITDVALSCGFNDPGYFTRMFQRKFGKTPSQFMREHRKVS
jgi:AraC-like DNA-binding protein